ncbi:hypothetical protein TSUD_48590 [Trifolium subterraneum]|uniref:FCP1 homology domain-containing protein n=1 Tax=Trifolium subterraneum TaxID=3900 RepID=A0A2Z6LXJ4_TRISU|nr:hypothetical protein TSUD_48590 [Trifolium subterraneum]
MKKKAPTKSIKDINRRRWRRKTPIKNVVAASYVVLSSIDCRISKLLTKMGITRLSSNQKRNIYKILKKITRHFNFHQESSLDTVCNTLLFDDNESTTTTLLPPSILNRKTIFLDLDETLIHSTTSRPPDGFDFVIRTVIDETPMDFYVVKRPGIDELLESLASRFEIVVFTAALKEYASLVLDRLDKNRFISHRLYRDSCRKIDGKLVKDLALVGRDLKSVVIVDDNPVSFSNQPENAILIKPFVDDIFDRELWKLRRFFDGSDCFDDMRDAIKFHVAEIERRR